MYLLEKVKDVEVASHGNCGAYWIATWERLAPFFSPSSPSTSFRDSATLQLLFVPDDDQQHSIIPIYPSLLPILPPLFAKLIRSLVR